VDSWIFQPLFNGNYTYKNGISQRKKINNMAVGKIAAIFV
jgi:hypothetical protein